MRALYPWQQKTPEALRETLFPPSFFSKCLVDFWVWQSVLFFWFVQEQQPTQHNFSVHKHNRYRWQKRVLQVSYRRKQEALKSCTPSTCWQVKHKTRGSAHVTRPSPDFSFNTIDRAPLASMLTTALTGRTVRKGCVWPGFVVRWKLQLENWVTVAHVRLPTVGKTLLHPLNAPNVIFVTL